jgi:F-type H+-transporting ATPase subunit a
MGPVELLGKLTKPLALALRLFGNILAGHFVVLSFLGLIFMFGHMPGINWGVGFGTTILVVGVMLLEVIVSLVQAYVFALLSATFIGMMQEHH